MPRTVGQISRHFGVRLVSGTMAEVPRNNARSLASQPRRHSERDRGEEDGNGAWWRSGKWALAAGAAAVAGEVVRQRAQCESGAVLKVKNVLPLGSIAERFRIEATLGEGGQAVVYKAYDKKDKKMVRFRIIAAFDPLSQKAARQPNSHLHPPSPHSATALAAAAAHKNLAHQHQPQPNLHDVSPGRNQGYQQKPRAGG